GELTQRVLDRGGGGPHGLLFTLDGDGDLLGPVQGDRVAVRQRGALGGHDPVAVVELVAGRGEHRVQVAAEGRQLDRLAVDLERDRLVCSDRGGAPGDEGDQCSAGDDADQRGTAAVDAGDKRHEVPVFVGPGQ